MQAFPDAKVILTLRNSESWYESVMKTIWQVSKERRAKGAKEASSLSVFELIWDGIFNGRISDKDYVIAQYEKQIRGLLMRSQRRSYLCLRLKKVGLLFANFWTALYPRLDIRT